jgi:LacI family transcriptional regulator
MNKRSSQSQTNRATLHEVAERAEVSVSTVSLVLSGKAKNRRISDDTCDKVRRAAEELNYAPNLLTRSLRKGRTNILSFFSTFRHREWGDIYMDRVASAIETSGGDLGYDILVQCNFNRDLKETFQFLNGGIAEGLILFAPESDDPLLAMLRKSPLPVVIMNGVDPLGQYCSVSDDVYQGMDTLASELLARGHTRIAALGAEGADIRDSALRIHLLESAIQRGGGAIVASAQISSRAAIETILKQWMKLPNPPTAVFCWNDSLAYQFLEICENMGIAIPDQLSIVGYDGIHWPSVSTHISSSVEVDIRSTAQLAVSMLDRVIENPTLKGVHEFSQVRFCEGTTLGPPQLSAMKHS